MNTVYILRTGSYEDWGGGEYDGGEAIFGIYSTEDEAKIAMIEAINEDGFKYEICEDGLFAIHHYNETDEVWYEIEEAPLDTKLI